MSATTVHLVNPLPLSLAHFENELAHQLRSGEHPLHVTTESSTSIEMPSGRRGRASTLAHLLRERRRMGRPGGRIIVVLWPALGYLDVLTWLPAARRNLVFLIVHDPVPLRRQMGYSPLARWLFRIAVRRSGVRVVSLTNKARAALVDATHTDSHVVPHPVLDVPRRPDAGAQVVVRVLGQFKSARNLEVLIEIGRSFTSPEIRLEIIGRGWPLVDGWHVDDRFVTEDEFASLVGTAHCVVIPYQYFYQSGIAVRCLESAVPVVGPQHEQLSQLYGPDWHGLVGDGEDWAPKVRAVLASPATDLEARLRSYARESQKRWWSLLVETGPVGQQRSSREASTRRGPDE